MEGRCEYKYLLRGSEIDELRRKIAGQIPPDSHGGGKPYTVSSLYFDNADRRLYYQTYDRAPYRYKLRLRVYGEPVGGDADSFFEIKSKLMGNSVKRRLLLPLSENERLWQSGRLPEDISPDDGRIARDILNLIEYDRLEPAAVVSYERLAFAAPGSARLRVTFDSALRIRTDRLDLRLGTGGTAVMPEDFCVLELKSGENLPLWLTRLISEHRLANRSYSKYGQTRFLDKLLQNNKINSLSQGESSWETISAESSAASDRSIQAQF